MADAAFAGADTLSLGLFLFLVQAKRLRTLKILFRKKIKAARFSRPRHASCRIDCCKMSTMVDAPDGAGQRKGGAVVTSLLMLFIVIIAGLAFLHVSDLDLAPYGGRGSGLAGLVVCNARARR